MKMYLVAGVTLDDTRKRFHSNVLVVTASKQKLHLLWKCMKKTFKQAQ